MKEMQLKKFKFVGPQKLNKTPSKVAKKYSIFFHPELPKRHNSYSKMWLLDQLYVKLGLKP